jgi:hypothetical protein
MVTQPEQHLVKTWLINDGGPLLAVDFALAAGWRGGFDDSEHSIPPDSDYTRACAAAYPAGRVDIGKSWGVIIGARENVAIAGWRRNFSSGLCYLIGAVFGDEETDQQLAEFLQAGTDSTWNELGVMGIDSGRLMLLHAACPGALALVDPEKNPVCIGDGLTMPVKPGEYAISSAEVKIEDAGLYCVVRWDAR